MKKLLIASLLLATFTSQAGLLDSIATSGWKDKKVTAKYKLDVYGYDARVYEFTPDNNPNMSCVFVTSNKSSGVACYPKTTTHKE